MHPISGNRYRPRSHNAMEEEARVQWLCRNFVHHHSYSYESLKPCTIFKPTKCRPWTIPNNPEQRQIGIPCAYQLAADVPPTGKQVKGWPRETKDTSGHVSNRMQWPNNLYTGGAESRCRTFSQFFTNIRWSVAQLRWGYPLYISNRLTCTQHGWNRQMKFQSQTPRVSANAPAGTMN